uniref:Putative gland protein G30C02 n=1 Tax=Heterodera glycines TaxID=51029 RepID=Q86DE2_HETGL|nr:putative gland protein G30C02 [Heterodera glycines]
MRKLPFLLLFSACCYLQRKEVYFAEKTERKIHRAANKKHKEETEGMAEVALFQMAMACMANRMDFQMADLAAPVSIQIAAGRIAFQMVDLAAPVAFHRWDITRADFTALGPAHLLEATDTEAVLVEENEKKTESDRRENDLCCCLLCMQNLNGKTHFTSRTLF